MSTVMLLQGHLAFDVMKNQRREFGVRLWYDTPTVGILGVCWLVQQLYHWLPLHKQNKKVQVLFLHTGSVCWL